MKSREFFTDNKLIFQQLRHFPGTLVLAIVFPLLAAIFEGFSIGFLLRFLQNLANQDKTLLFQTGIQWFDGWILGKDQTTLNQLIWLSALILIATWLRSICNYLSYVYQRIAQEKLVNSIRKRIYEQIQGMSLEYFNKAQSGTIINILTTETNELRSSIAVFGELFNKGLLIIVYVLIALWISRPLTFLVLILLSTVSILVTKVRNWVSKYSFQLSESRGNLTALASEIVTGIATIKAFATENYERKRIYQASDRVLLAATELAKRGALISPLTEIFGTTVFIGIMILAIEVLVKNGVLTLAALMTFLYTLLRLVPNLKTVNNCFVKLSSLIGSIHSIEQFLHPDDKPYLLNGYRQFDGFQKEIEFVGVSFGYDENQQVLNNITFTIEKGTTVALVGTSGSGKSTLANLIPRFYEPTAGKILFDGIALKEFELHSLRRRIGIVSQDIFLFNASVRENIAYGSDGVSNQEIIKAAKLAHALNFIEALPEAFETVLGPRGVRLSGGQRQRIAIARALLKNPEILILDEATSALDTVSERLIQRAVETLSVDRTVIVIAHRLSTIINSNKIIVLEHGQIIEQGNYQELITQPGILQKFYNMQIIRERNGELL